VIRTGQKLTVYVPNASADRYRDLNELSFAQKQARIGKTVTTTAVSQSQSTVVLSGDPNDYVLYTVKQGDTIWEIAKGFPGTTETDIMRLNNISDASKIQVGQLLRIKPKT